MKHKPQIVEASRLADLALSHDDPSRFSEVINSDCEFRTELKNQWFACVWGDNCVTSQHLGDAAIHGPFATEEEAEQYLA